MNNDENNPGIHPISAEMEARILAWVSGEASAAEAAALEAVVAGDPALAAFKATMETVRKLAAEAVAPDRPVLRMSEARRSALLRDIGEPAKAADVPLLAAIQRRQRTERRWMMAVAACLTTGLFLSLMIPSFQRKSYVRDAAESRAKAAYATSADLEADALAGQKKEAVALAAPRIELPVSDLAVLEEPAAAPRREARTAALEGDFDAKAVAPIVLEKSRVAGSGPAPVPSDTLAAPGERADVEGDAPLVLGAFVVDAPEEVSSYRASSTLAGTRVRTNLKDTAASINAATEQFLEDTQAGKGKNLLALSPKVAGAVSAPAGAASSNEAAAALAPFLADVAQDEGSYRAVDPRPARQAADAELQAVLDRADKAAPVAGPEDARIYGTGSPAGIPDAPRAGAPARAFGEVSAAREPVSTFSLHVSDVSFRLAQAALARGEAPDAAQIRPEEFYNAFDYGDPLPAMSDGIACHTEQSADPVMQQRNLLRIAMRVPATGHAANQPLRLTVLLDTSGSMEREDRAAAVRRALKVLVSLLGRDDRITLIGFARSPRLLAEQVHGDAARSLLDIIAATPADGGTNLEEAIKLGTELAQRQFTAGAQNRVVLLTDGAANLGDADPAHLAAQVESLRQRDIAFDACGVGTAGIDDSVLETLTRKGSGRYYVLDSPEAADAGFARQLAGAFRPAAENVKVQVRFNPARVGNYRLIGFENHRLNQEDFRNDTVAAAALAAGEAAVALYEVEALPQGDGDLGQVYVRFRDTATGSMVERSWALPYEPYVAAFDKATPSLQLAGTAALLAEKLRGGARGDAIKLAPLAPVVNALRSHYAHEVPVQELAAMYQQMRRLRAE